jgi:hypothetical protein
MILHTDFDGGCTSLHFYQQGTSFPFKENKLFSVTLIIVMG